jgi:hypothetical protein
MRHFVRIFILVMPVLILGATAAEAGCVGAGRYYHRRCTCCCAAPCTCCQQQCFTVMKRCKEIVYEEKECTAYQTVYEEVVEKQTVEAVKFVEETQYRCQPTTVMQPCESTACAAAKCGQQPECCPPAKTCEMVPVQVLKKVPYTAVREVRYEKTEEKPKVLTKQVPYTFTCCVPKVVYKEVPVQVCCPMPCCCRCTCGASNCCGK